VKDAMESKRREMCQVIKEDLIARVSKEVEEKGREKTVGEAMEEALKVI
jgi:hypothetical protein